MIPKNPDETSSDIRPPERRTIAHYEIESLLGSGGMGEVYAALDTQLGRLVALKLLPQDLTRDNDRLRRFQQEARTVSALNHPNIMTVYEIGEADSRHYIATELVKGATLRSRMAETLPVPEIIDVASQVASALAAAHEAGIIHRDVKPENVMIRTDGYVKLLDFGLAKLSESTGVSMAPTEVRTMPGTVMGTVNYMSPEQARGEELDGRSDLWSVGVVIYEMLAGRKPFERSSASDVIGHILQTEPLPLARFAPDVPPELERIVRRCLRKKRDERYQSAKDLLLDLKELRRQLEIGSAVRDSQPQPVAGFSRRGWIAAAAGAVVLAAIAGVLLLGLPRRSAALTQQDTVLLADFTNRTGDPVFDGTLRDALAVQVGQSPFLNLVADSRVRETLRYMGRSPDEKLTIPIAREICQRQGIKAILTGSIAQLGSQYVLTVEALNGQSGDALVREQVQVAHKEDVLHSLGPAVSALRSKLGESLRSIQKFDTPADQATTSSLEALRAFSAGSELATAGKNYEAIPFFRRAVEIDPQFALAHTRLAIAFYNTFEDDRANDEAMKAYQLRERSTERERFFIEQMYFQGVTGEIEKAIETLELWERTYPSDSLAHLGLAVNYLTLGQYDKSVDEARKGITLDPNWAYSYLTEANALQRLNRGAEARAVLELAVSRKLGSYWIRSNLFHIGGIQDDERLMRQQVEWAASDPMGDYVFASQGQYALTRGRAHEALASFRHAADVANARRGGQEGAAWDLAEYALWAALFGRSAEAAAISKESLHMSRRTVLMLWWLGRAFAFSGHGDEASRIADDLAAKHPNDTMVQWIFVPTIRAAVAIASRDDAATGIDLLRTVRYELWYDGTPVLFRGLAYLRQKDAVRAQVEFDKIRAQPDWFKWMPTYALATLGAARAAALGGNFDRSRELYGEFLQLWKDADPDLPILIAAKREYAALTQ